MRWVSAQRRRQRGLQERGPPRARACMASARNSQTTWEVCLPRAASLNAAYIYKPRMATTACVGDEFHRG